MRGSIAATADLADLFSNALGPESGVGYRLSRALAERFAGMAVVEGLSHTFDLDEYAAAGRCEATPSEGVHAEFADEWSRAGGLSRAAVTGLFDVTWESRARCGSPAFGGTRATSRACGTG